LRVGDLAAPAEGGKLAPPTLPHGLHQVRISMTHEIEEGVGLAVFLTHEEQRHVRRQEEYRGAQPQPSRRGEHRQALAPSAIPYLVVVLNTDDEAVAG
jgi:hypothetical protein